MVLLDLLKIHTTFGAAEISVMPLFYTAADTGIRKIFFNICKNSVSMSCISIIDVINYNMILKKIWKLETHFPTLSKLHKKVGSDLTGGLIISTSPNINQPVIAM